MNEKKPNIDDIEKYKKDLHDIADDFGLGIEYEGFLDESKDIGKEIEEISEQEDSIKERISKKDMSKTKDTSKMEKDSKLEPISTPVLLTLKAYQRMIGYAIRYANSKLKKEEWREVYGILIGKIEEHKQVIVRDAIPVCVGEKTGVELEPIHYVDVSQIDQSIWRRSIENQKTDFIVGWWHTHPGLGFYFSKVDLTTQLGYQVPNHYAMGLVFDLTKRTKDSLGVAAFRARDPEYGIQSDYKPIEMKYNFKINEIIPKVKKFEETILKNMGKILKEINYIESILRKKKLAQLQRNFGLIMVPKRDIKATEDKEEAEEIEEKIYIWDPNFFKKSYRIPKFRERLENDIKNCENILRTHFNKDEIEKYEEKRLKFHKKFKKILEKPNEWYEKMILDFGNTIEKIYRYFNYLDTDERKIIEYFEERASDYYKILDNLNDKTKFDLEVKI